MGSNNELWKDFVNELYVGRALSFLWILTLVLKFCDLQSWEMCGGIITVFFQMKKGGGVRGREWCPKQAAEFGPGIQVSC